MDHLRELQAETDLKTCTSSAKLSLGNGRLFKLKHKYPGNGLSLEATSSRWNATYDLKSKDITVQRKTQTGAGTFTIKQRVPGHKFFLVPSPEFAFTSKPIYTANNRIKYLPTVSYDTQKRVGILEQDLVLNNKYKASMKTDTTVGLRNSTFSLAAQLKPSWASSMGVSVSRASGPVLKYQASCLGAGTPLASKVKVDLKLKNKEAEVEVAPLGVTGKVHWTLNSNVQLGKKVRPTLRFGAKADL